MKKTVSLFLTAIMIIISFSACLSAVSAVDPTGHEHDYQLTEAVERTCTEDGYDLYICSVCGDEKREVTATAAHMYKEKELVPADCENEGYVILVCSVCGSENKVDTPKTDHLWSEGELVRQRSTFIDGKVRYTCKYNSEHTYEISIPSKFSSSKRFKAEVIIAAVAVICIPVVAIPVYLWAKKKKSSVTEKTSKK